MTTGLKVSAAIFVVFIVVVQITGYMATPMELTDALTGIIRATGAHSMNLAGNM